MKTFSVNINGVTARVRIERSAKGLVWRYKFRYPAGRAGRQNEGTLGAVDLLTRAMIRTMLMDRIQQVMSGPPARQVLLSEAIKHYMERHGCHLSAGGQKEKAVLEAFKTFAGDRPLNDITLGLIEDHRATRMKVVETSTVNREMTAFKSFWNKAILWGLCKGNPTQGIKKLREAPGRVRYLVDDEWERLEKAVNSGPWWLYPACILARYAGLRQGEILRLKWSDVDLGNALLMIRNTKANRNEVIPLCKPLVEALWDLPREGEYVLCAKTGAPIRRLRLSRAWWQALETAEIINLRFHDLRHDFASRIVMAGRGIEAARALLRHKDLRMTERYAHLAPSYLRDTVEAISGGISGERFNGNGQNSKTRGGEVVAEKSKDA